MGAAAVSVQENSRGDFSYELVAGEERARQALSELSEEALLGLDTETFWDREAGNYSSLSLLQLGTRRGRVFVFDALALSPELFRSLVESPSIVKVAHNARFDQGVLTGVGLRPAGLLDTLALARTALILPSHSLAAVTEHLWGARLDKSLQKSNWRRRPLTNAQIAYAAIDAHTTLRVYEELTHTLAEQGRLEAALRAARVELRGVQSESEGKMPRRRRPAPAPGPPLTAAEKLLVTRLKRWRLLYANERGRPAYMVCPDRTLEHLARERPRTLEALGSIHGLGDSKIEQFGAELLRELLETE